jgi:soluble lytic murein transglycosylase
VDWIPERYAGRGIAEALARSEALARAGESRASIRAAESVLGQLPDDFDPHLLARGVRERLYPRPFYDRIRADGERYGADPPLLLALMREESRFDPRARSSATARGLLQLVIPTALDVARQLGLESVSGEDLYQPQVVIPLGAKYLSDLLRQFDGDACRAVAAYNAGPYQVRLWSRLSPPGEDAFFSTINFDETRAYVARVLSSYETYREVYGRSPDLAKHSD